MNGNSPTAFILVAPEADSSGAAKALSDFIASNGAEWWHWVKDTWIIGDPMGRTSIWWRELLSAYWAPAAVHFIFFQIMPGAGWGATLPVPALEWIRERFGGTIEQARPALPAPKPGR